MTVQELIDQLENLNPEARVILKFEEPATGAIVEVQDVKSVTEKLQRGVSKAENGAMITYLEPVVTIS